MYDNDYEEKEKKSLLKDMAEKGISKKIKAMPLKTKLIIIGIIAGIVFFLLIFIVLTSALIPLLFDSGGNGNISPSDLSYIETNSEDNYWWPIGGSEVVKDDNGVEFAIGTPTTTTITSNYEPNRVLTYDSNGDGVVESHPSPHYAIDISDAGKHYIIAVASGVVSTVVTGCANNGSLGNYCNGGFGNYIIITHHNGASTTYAHLKTNSITVSQGDEVKQGQIIAEMGNSGNSSGQHLHFEIKVNEVKQNPLEYVSGESPRPVTITSGSNLADGNPMLAMLQSWEGTGPMKGDSYVVYDDGYGTLTVGHGVTIGYNVNRFREKGIDTSKLGSGSKISKEIVDAIELEILEEQRSSVISLLNNNGISLEEYQIDALVIRMYNVGNVNGFPEKYKTYGVSEGLRDNYMMTPVTSNGIYSEGLKRRREAEWNLFYYGTYTYNY